MPSKLELHVLPRLGTSALKCLERRGHGHLTFHATGRKSYEAFWHSPSVEMSDQTLETFLSSTPMGCAWVGMRDSVLTPSLLPDALSTCLRCDFYINLSKDASPFSISTAVQEGCLFWPCNYTSLGRTSSGHMPAFSVSSYDVALGVAVV